ncbi:MAG: FIST C-terminal domain-containing protein [Clostridiales Family XIII bacterium]|nr:FIST C-terminal domain-containing protein [Clostridiales Family XIII bacterium]
MEMRNAYTTEIDEAADALGEILDQLDTATLKANTAGVISCHPDFIESGVASYIAERLPFPVVGCTTIYGSANGEMGNYLLQVAALTADDARFAAVTSGPLGGGNEKEALGAMAAEAREALGEEPKLALIFFPVLKTVPGDALLGILDAAVGGMPLFGTVVAGSEPDLSDGRVLAADGAASTDRVAALFFAGAVNPRFYVYSIANKNIRPNKAMVTDSDGYVVKKINGLSYFDYLRSVGMAVENEGVDFTIFPNMVDYGGGRVVALGVYHVFEDGSILSAGKMPVGTTLTIGVVDQDSVFSTDYSALAAIKADEKPDCLFVVPCITRYFMLAPDSAAEARKIDDAFDMPYTLFYSGGEICPLRDEGGKLYNQFHNYSLTALAL